MPEIKTLTDIATLGANLQHLQNDFNGFKVEVKEELDKLTTSIQCLSNNVSSALTDLKMADLKFQTTSQKVQGLENDIQDIKERKIRPMENTIGMIKWVATASFSSVLIFFLYILAEHFNLF